MLFASLSARTVLSCTLSLFSFFENSGSVDCSQIFFEYGLEISAFVFSIHFHVCGGYDGVFNYFRIPQRVHCLTDDLLFSFIWHLHV